MRDIETREDIEALMRSFYSKALKDQMIGYIFTDVAKLDLEHHLPIIVDFWEMILFGTVDFQGKYKRSPMQKHIELNEKEPLMSVHFKAWLRLFESTIDEMYSGKLADLARIRAHGVAKTMMIKFSHPHKIT